MTTAIRSYRDRHERPLAIDGIAAVANRLTDAFGDQAIAVAERWAEESDVRYRAVATILKRRAEEARTC